ncbi:bifunctional 4-hydroxy-2-oxoglutarate aldolase/2-dehydro-3-deoxy-phosphogluconate aldolase [Propionibacteriaceae bacterium G1746]|uniref:bifunctional 4-hydroxy-2-oxoglutarate aldolase/2-dehydro-3-deoxy-phosphogluconate aldolase n=1 Tax=Aestuariimicrobium sp. G57 TaxID=3418485 RepID=UPI003C131DC9
MTRLPLPECITASRMIVLVDRRFDPEQNDADWLATVVPVLEVMVQEGMTVFSLPLADIALLAELREMFIERAWFGVHDVLTLDDTEQALAHAPEFLLAGGDDHAVVERAAVRGVVAVPAALTPNELRAAWQSGAAAVQVLPADLLGSNYPEALARLLPGVGLIARGNLGGWSMGRWFEHGAVACVADSPLTGDAFNGGNLSHLRDRCRTYRDVVPAAPDKDVDAQG